MARILILILILLLVGAGGGGAWWFGIRGEPVPFMGEDGTKKAKTSDILAPTQFVELAPIAFPVMQDGQVRRLMSVVISLEVRGADAQTAVADVRTRLRDALLSELYALYSLEFVRERDDGLKFVKQRLAGAARRVLGNRLVALYVQSVGHRNTTANS